MAESELMRELHANLWGSLRHVFNTDRVLLGVLYVTNFAGFVMLANTSRSEPIVALATVVAMILLNSLIALSLSNSKKEVLGLVGTLIDVYNDNGLAKYFDNSKLQYYQRRYTLWAVLVPTVAGVAIALGLLIGFHRWKRLGTPALKIGLLPNNWSNLALLGKAPVTRTILLACGPG